MTTQELMTLVISETSESEGQQVKDKPVDTIAPLSASVTSSVTMELEPMILQNARLTSKRIVSFNFVIIQTILQNFNQLLIILVTGQRKTSIIRTL